MESDVKQDYWMSGDGEALVATDELCRFLVNVARFHAVRRGLTSDETEDCAMEFVKRMLGRNERALQQALPEHCFPAWLHQCAKNFVSNFCRAKAVLGQREAAWPETVGADGSRLHWDCADGAPAPDVGLLREEFWERVTGAIEQLPPMMRELLVRHHLHDECVQNLAAASGRTPHAVEQMLYRARRRLRSLLERMGLTERELRAYIIISSPLQHGCLNPAVDHE